MKKKLFIVLLLLFIALNIYAQYIADSLISVANKESNPQKIAELYLEASTYISKYDTSKAKTYIATAAQNITKKNLYLRALKNYATAFLVYDFDFEKAQKNALEGVELIKGMDDKKSIDLTAQLWYVYAIVEQRKDRAEDCLDILLKKCIPNAKKTGNRLNEANYNIAAALVLTNELNIDNALQYLKESWKLLENEPQTELVLDKQIKSHLYIAEASLRKEDFNTAKKHLEEAKNLLTISKENYWWSEYYNINSIYYVLNKQYNKALLQANMGLEILKHKSPSYDYVRLTQMKSWILRMLKRPDEASNTLKPLIEMDIAKKVKFNSSIVYQELAYIQAEKGNYDSAYEYLWKRIDVSDSMYQSKQNETITEMETKFRTAEKEKQVTLKELEINKKNQYMVLLGTSTFIFLGLGIFAFIYFKNKRQLSLQREINLQQKLKQIEQEEELKLAQAILNGEERERQRVAKDLHDGLGGMLTGIKLKFASWSAQHLKNNQSEQFDEILEQLNITTSELRSVARNLMPESLLKNGLSYALSDLCEFYSNNRVKVNFVNLNLQENFPLNFQINVYRIIQELLSNAVKHAKATSILVQCSQEENSMLITVDDNGIGMDVEKAKESKSLGIKSLQNRVDLLNGKMEIISEKNKGTSVNIELPAQYLY